MFDFKTLYEAKTTDEAVRLLGEHPGAHIVAGGTDVFIKLREGAFRDRVLVAIYDIDALRGITTENDGTLRIGPLTTFFRLAETPVIQKNIPVLGDAASTVGGPQIRAVGTIGGNVCNGVTSADTASTLLAYDAILEYTGPEGTRRVPISEHYVGAGKTALKPAELLTAVLIPAQSYENTSGYYIKYAMREAMDIAVLGCSANVRLSKDGATLERLRLAFGVAAPVPVRAASAEKAAAGKAPEEAISAAAEAVFNDINPRDSWRAGKEFRLHIAREITKRSIRAAVRRARGEAPGGGL